MLKSNLSFLFLDFVFENLSLSKHPESNRNDNIKNLIFFVKHKRKTKELKNKSFSVRFEPSNKKIIFFKKGTFVNFCSYLKKTDSYKVLFTNKIIERHPRVRDKIRFPCGKNNTATKREKKSKKFLVARKKIFFFKEAKHRE